MEIVKLYELLSYFIVAISVLIIVLFGLGRALIRAFTKPGTGDDESSESEASTMTSIVVLVHGTFAKNAKWCSDGSQLRKAIASGVRGASFSIFRWSGLNSFRARLTASEKLEHHILKMREQHPKVPVFVIAHSHGGNVALSMLSRSEIANRVAGLITLSTPFFHIEQDPPRGILRYSIGVFAFFAILWIMAAFLESVEGFWIFVLAYFVSAVGGSFVYRWSMRVSESFSKYVPQSTFPAERVLILRTAHDEASLVLGFTSLLNWIISTVYRLFYGIVDGFRDLASDFWGVIKHRLGVTKLLFFMITGLVMFIIVALYAEPGEPLEGSETLQVGFYVIAAILFFVPLTLLSSFALTNFLGWGTAFVLLSIMMIPFPLLVGVLASLSAGPELLLSATFIRVAAEATPPGDWKIAYLDAGRDAGGRRTAALRHSRLYDDQTSLSKISNWMNQRIGLMG